jgi:hypothetical protein
VAAAATLIPFTYHQSLFTLPRSRETPFVIKEPLLPPQTAAVSTAGAVGRDSRMYLARLRELASEAKTAKGGRAQARLYIS